MWPGLSEKGHSDGCEGNRLGAGLAQPNQVRNQ